ncbi:tetratricopeptide repeat protein [Kaistella flava (ex Peng et al. 2021)]|nr:tetratricopeptide repeat protein [Kaistella flava (ex Peng et al. 2021)]
MIKKTIPTDRSIAWISLVPQLLLMAFLFGIFYILKVKEPFVFVGFTYLLLSFGLKKIFLKNHNKGIVLTKEGKDMEAIASFKKSASFFSKYSWIDRYRYITLLGSSKYSYREMALINIAFCYVQLGEIEKAKEYYQNILREYPGNNLAKQYLLKLNSPQA